MIQKTYKVDGMSCAACAGSVESLLNSFTGVKKSEVNLSDSSVYIEYDSSKSNIDQFNQKLKQAGYAIKEPVETTEQANKLEKEKLLKSRNQAFFSIMLTLPVFVLSMFFTNLNNVNWILLFLTTIVLSVFGRQFFIIAYKQARMFSSNMDTLVALGTGSAYLLSLFNTIFPEYLQSKGLTPHVYYEAAAVIVSLILLGRYLEDKAKANTSASVEKLVGLRVKNARIIHNGQTREVPIEEVEKGDTLFIKPGERIPLDGIITKGNSTVDESMITGEPVPIDKQKNDEVIGSTINLAGSFQMKVMKTGKSTLLSQIIETVKKAQRSKAPVQKLADKIASVFVPVVILIAIVTAVLWMSFYEGDAFTYAFLSFVTVLIISCPCALGLATPTAIITGVGVGAEKGILIKNAESLEIAQNLDTIVLDKTGTITSGKPNLETLLSVNKTVSETHLRSIVFAMENQSEHPVAKSIVESLKNENPEKEIESFDNYPGMGIKSKIDGSTYFIGNNSLLSKNNIIIPEETKLKADQLINGGQTIIYIADAKNVIGIIGISDKIKSSAKEIIAHLKHKNIDIHMLSGDNQKSADKVAKEVGIDIVKAELLPDDKLEYVKKLQKENKKVAMVGDGINDAPALTQANLGIAMGDGTDIALESADIALLRGDINKIYAALKLSVLTNQTIKQNLIWAFIYNIIAIPIAAGILFPFTGFLLNPMIASGAMALSSLSVVTNSLRLKRKKLPV